MSEVPQTKAPAPTVEELMSPDYPGGLPNGLNETQARVVHDNWDSSAEDLVGAYLDDTVDMLERGWAVWLLYTRRETGDALQASIINDAIAGAGTDFTDMFIEVIKNAAREIREADTGLTPIEFEKVRQLLTQLNSVT